MTKFGPTTLAIAALALAGCDSPEEADLDRQVFNTEERLDAWVQMWNTYDLNLVDELFLTDSSVTYFSSEREGLIQGHPALIEHHRGFGFIAGGREPDQELWVEDVVSTVFGETAIVNGIWFFGDRAAPRDSTSRGPMTIVYAHTNEGYRIAHMHFANY